MKTKAKFNINAPHFMLLMVGFFMLSTYVANAQAIRDVIPGYKGWDGNPDSITVYIDSSFTAAEKDSVRVGMKRWNDAGCKPKFKEVTTKPAKITVKEGDPGEGNAGVAEITSVDGKNTEVIITIRNNPVPGLKETATHELGHAIGLDDTNEATNPGDVMKGSGPSNGTDGNLSKHDTTELKAAIASITVPAPAPAGEKPLKKRATSPPTAIPPNVPSNIQFDLGIPFPPGSIPSAVPVGTIDVEILSLNLVSNNLTVQVIVGPNHGYGQFYLDIMIEPPLPDSPVFFLGYHFVSPNPVEPLTFQCPCEIYEEAGMVHVDWKEYHNYPFPNRLRAHLNVDGTSTFLARGGENFLLQLSPGMHTFSLHVDDFEVNECNFTATYNVQGGPLVPIASWAVMIGLFLILAQMIFRIKKNGK